LAIDTLWTLVKLADLDEIDRRLYLAGVTLHDLNKIVLKQLGSVRLDGQQWEKYQQGFNSWAEASEDEIVYLHLYPDYFFTPETALIMSRAFKSSNNLCYPRTSRRC
jgi:hypothetical protein